MIWSITLLSANGMPPPVSAEHADTGLQSGVTREEASNRLKKFGPNATPDATMHLLQRALSKFWEPVPWMLDAAVMAGLLVFNTTLSLVQEVRAQATLATLKSRLALTASVRRDAEWATVPAADLAPGDVIKLSLGAVVAADVRLTGGEILLDQSLLTGESVPIEAGPGLQAMPVRCRGGTRLLRMSR